MCNYLMDPMIFFGALTTIYVVLLFFDRFFKSCMHYPYDAFLTNTGLQIQFLRLKWHTTAFNRLMLRWSAVGSQTRKFLQNHFTVGVFVALSLLPIGLILICITIFGDQRSKIVDERLLGFTPTVRVEILLPGVNLPLDEVGYYVTTLLCSTLVHELGHALAASMEDVPVTGFGFHLYFCLPLAYTEISVDHLNSLKWFRKLRILCAGIWHNVLFTIFCYLLIVLCGPMISSLYNIGQSVIVTEVAPNSPLLDTGKGLVVGDIITQINSCRVRSQDDWFRCIYKELRSKTAYCVSSDFIIQHDESINADLAESGTLQCCDKNNSNACCFEHSDYAAEPMEVPQHVCLNVRRTIEDSSAFCVGTGNCEDSYCLRPMLNNATAILTFERHSLDQAKLPMVIYMGHPGDVVRTIRISQFVPNKKYVYAQWADIYTLFLKYNLVFSFGLALINAIPCFGFDGYHINSTIIDRFLVNRVTERAKRYVISVIVASFGSLLFAIALLKVLVVNTVRYFNL